MNVATVMQVSTIINLVFLSKNAHYFHFNTDLAPIILFLGFIMFGLHRKTKLKKAAEKTVLALSLLLCSFLFIWK